MQPDEKKLLEEVFELSKENNKLLHRIRGVQKWQAFWSILKIVVVIGVALGVAYYVEPYFNKMMSMFSQISGVKEGIDNIFLQSLLKNVKP